MVDIALESVRAAVLLGIVVFLWDVGRNKFDRTRNGWNFIVGGFGLLLFGSLMDISDNFEGLNFLVVVGDTEVEAFLEKFVGFLGGFVVVAVGLVRWIPSVQRLNSEISQRKQAENALRAAHDTLEQRVGVRTVELEREIDERKRAEEAFSRKSALLEMTFESTSQGIVVYDADLRLTAFNKQYADFNCYPPGFLRLGMSFEEIARFKAERGDHGPGDAEELVKSRVLGKRRRERVREERTMANGRIYALVRDPMPGGGSVTTHTDITELRKAEQEIAQKSALLEKTFESMSQGISVYDADLKLATFNQQIIDLMDFPPGFLRLGMPYEEIARFKAERGDYGPGDVDEHVRKRVLNRRERKPNRKERTWPNGRVTLMRRDVLPDGGYVATHTDITEQETAKTEMLRAKEQAELANRTKSKFLANMSHELRTPLNAILGFSELMSNATLGPLGNPKYEEYAKDINDSGRHLLELIQDILDLARIEAGKLELDEEDIDVARAIRSCMVLVKERASNGGVKLRTDLPDGLPALHADKRKLKQILVNLLSNAVKFTPAGGEVTLKIWSRPDSGYVFQVIDTGIGIALADIPAALSPFGQVDSALSRKFAGTGLGLPLTKSLVEMHGGSLDLQSEEGAGTTVTVRFPKERIVASLDNSDSLDVEDRAAS